jgi:hypothetical protein
MGAPVEAEESCVGEVPQHAPTAEILPVATANPIRLA